ncbi:hypothetical protein BD324DRAFT_110123 [Kockovaella imperatae]|uniref:Mitochondrial carrier domain-containing protein n=1 Tax=Kockovaella imperatae TaxID=4999 RepID=A0A1Y1UAB9_9TREE|nr:hypothetical protein BD324DRAFT_110123 [Kockovaella imperatae]ORX34983.1 hypothetical protein BD324DRAFT_110123 [Kockovaella imperatae]
MFRRPSKLFRPSRVDTFGGLKHLALSTDQNLSASFIRSLMSSKQGLIAVTLTILPPLLINTTLGFLLFTSHSFFSLSLAKLPFFHHPHDPTSSSSNYHPSHLDLSETDGTDRINLHTLMTGPSVIPYHPTLLSAIAGAGAGLLQGAAFTPIENVVKLLRDSASSITSILLRVLQLPLPKPATTVNTPASPLQALKQFLSSESWVKSPSWWTGWRWAMARDAISYSVFFAAFDVTRRVALRVRGFMTGTYEQSWSNFILFSPRQPTPNDEDSSGHAPTSARVAQAVTIVTGGVMASVAAEVVSRPIRASQKILSGPEALSSRYPLLHTYKTQGIKPFIRSETSLARIASESPLRRAVKRLGWRMAAVGPWGFGFLVWAWVGGEV